MTESKGGWGENYLSKQSLKRWVFKEERKEESDSDERIESGREFQIEGAAQENERSPKETVLVEGIVSLKVSDEERRDLAGVQILIRSERQEGPDRWIA